MRSGRVFSSGASAIVTALSSSGAIWLATSFALAAGVAGLATMTVGAEASRDGVVVDESAALPDPVRRRMLRSSPPPAVPPDPTNRVADDPAAARFGQRLFFDPRLSPAEVSCATCHDPAKGFTDGLPLATGIAEGSRNAISLINAAHQRWQQWDGGADSLWAQALRPIEHPDEMGGDRVSVARLIGGDAELRRQYEAIFGPFPELDDALVPARARPAPPRTPLAPMASDSDDALAEAWDRMRVEDRAAIDGVLVNVGKALAAYQRLLTSGPTAFDRYVLALREERADAATAMSASARRGAALFFGSANCWECHTGPMFSDGEFHSIGMPPRAGGMPRDPGRFIGAETVAADPFNAAGVHSDDPQGEKAKLVQSLRRSSTTWGEFRTPSLREVARTAPYMHQGQLATLREVVEFYSTLEDQLRIGHQHETILVPLSLTESEIDDLVVFLESLTGDPLPEALLRAPAAPEEDDAGGRDR